MSGLVTRASCPCVLSSYAATRLSPIRTYLGNYETRETHEKGKVPFREPDKIWKLLPDQDGLATTAPWERRVALGKFPGNAELYSASGVLRAGFAAALQAAGRMGCEEPRPLAEAIMQQPFRLYSVARARTRTRTRSRNRRYLFENEYRFAENEYRFAENEYEHEWRKSFSRQRSRISTRCPS
jgi:hypothetical protein